MITAQYLIDATGCDREAAMAYAVWLEEAAHRWGIDTLLRQAAWVAQCAHESALFTRVEENLWYTTPARLIAVWPMRFRLPLSEREDQLDRFFDGRRNARRYVRNPERLANFVYADRLGNSDEFSGHGWAYRGRGLIQLTGRANYAAYEMDCSYPVVTVPDMLLQPFAASDSAAWYWSRRGCNQIADRRDWDKLTRQINGGLTGASDRLRLTLSALAAAGVPA